MLKKYIGLSSVIAIFVGFLCLMFYLGNPSADDSLNNTISYKFKGAGNFTNTLSGTTAITGATGTYNDTVTLPVTGHGYLAGSNIYISGCTGTREFLNGLRKISAVATNSITVIMPPGTYVSGTTPQGTESLGVGFNMDKDYVFKGIELHLSAAGGATEDLEVSKDAYAGSQFDVKIYDYDTASLVDDLYLYDIWCHKDDVIKATYTNTNSRTWGLTFYAKERY